MIREEPDNYDFVTVEGDFVTAWLIVWRRYRTITTGVVERMLDDNPHLAKLHRYSPFLPIGTQVRIPLYSSILAGAPRAKENIRWWETVAGKIKPIFLSGN